MCTHTTVELTWLAYCKLHGMPTLTDMLFRDSINPVDIYDDPDFRFRYWYSHLVSGTAPWDWVTLSPLSIGGKICYYSCFVPILGLNVGRAPYELLHL